MVALMWLGLAWADELPETLVSVDMHAAAYVELMARASGATDPADAAALELRAAETLWAGGLWDTAELHFSRLTPSSTTKLGTSYTFFQADEPMKALQALDGTATAETHYLAGWCYLELGQTQAAYDAWGTVPAGSDLHQPAVDLQYSIGGTWKIPHRSPGLAGAMSAVLPGAGQLYAGNGRDAATALFVNGLLAAFNWQLIERELWAGVGLVGFVQLGFYGGNILAGVNSAHKFNRMAWNDKLKSIDDYAPRLEANGTEWVMAVDSPGPE